MSGIFRYASVYTPSLGRYTTVSEGSTLRNANFDCGNSFNIQVTIDPGTFSGGTSFYRHHLNNASQPYTGVAVSGGISGDDYTVGVGCFLYIKANDGEYYLINESAKKLSNCTYDESMTDWVTSSQETIYFDFTVPEYVPNGASLYFALCDGYVHNAHGNQAQYFYFTTNPVEATNFSQADNKFGLTTVSSCTRANTMTNVTLSYPSFTCSSYAKVSIPKIQNAYKMELYRSTDNGNSWSKIHETSTSTSMTAAATWTITDKSAGSVSVSLNCPPPIPAQSISVSDTNVPCKYKTIYYGSTENTVTGSNLLEILDLTMPTANPIPNISSYSNRTAETFSITNTTITDLSRISFKEMFARTSLPGTTQPCVADTLEYDVQALDENNSLETNLGNYFLLPNANYEYRIYPLLDGSTAYKSTANNAYQKFNYTKSTTKLEMTRPIEMGSIQPTKIKLLLNPSIDNLPSGATLTFYVANNGNDENIVWEELPSSCLGTTANPDCDIYYFTNESKTADTWKVMVKVVADKGSASSQVTLKSLVVVINGGEADDRPSGYKYLTNVILDATATTVNLEMPQGYRKYKIIGNIVNTDKRGNPYVRLNSLTKTYDTYCYYNGSETTKTDRFCYVNTSSGKCPQFEMELFCYNSKWYGSMKAIGDDGFSNSHSIMPITGELSTINLICDSATYPMQPGTEFTILGVD